MGRRLELVGQKFGRLEVRQMVGTHRHGDVTWLCSCDCGNTIVVRGGSLKDGHTKSCGCFKREVLIAANTTHGLLVGGAQNRYRAMFTSIKARCYNKRNPEYKNYGARGISVFSGWCGEGGFINFYSYIMEFLGECPPGMSLDRIDNNKGYEPGNLRWATDEEQANNTRHNVWIEYSGEKKTVTQWARVLSIHVNTLRRRLYVEKLSIEDAFNIPLWGGRADALIIYKDDMKTLAQWARVLGVKSTTLRMRLIRGWSVERAFTIPVGAT